MKKYIPLTIGLLAVALLLAFAVGQGKAQVGRLAENSTSPDAVDGVVKSYIPVQGRLTDASGNPLDGSYSITFRLYNVNTGGTELCHDTNSVHVDQGLFNSEIWGNCQDEITGEQLYLGIEVGSDGEMSPRQPIYAVPYAWSLRPGAVISASLGSTNANLHVETWSETGRGVRAYAMSTTGENYGVVGASRSSTGYGGYFYNNGGGTGLYGTATSDTGGIGVYGESTIGSAVYGKSTSGTGLYGFSGTSNAIYADTQNASHNYGVYTPDNLYSLNYHLKGAVMHVVQNGGSEPLEPGNVAVFSGMLASTDASEPPVILVAKAAAADSTAVAGVVYARSSLDGAEQEGAVQPGEYLLLVVQGPARVKVSAAAGGIQAGDLLSSDAQAGFAAKASAISLQGVQTVLPGTVFAKALEAMESGEGWIYVFVTLQ
jgi:hypothetical protein